MLTKINYYSSKVKEKQKLLEDLAIYDDISKIRNKFKIIKTLNKKVKKRLHPIDLFYFDKKRWQKQTVDKVKDNKDKHANQTSLKTMEKLMTMKNESSLLNQVSSECELILKEVLLKGERFMTLPMRTQSKRMIKKSSKHLIKQ